MIEKNDYKKKQELKTFFWLIMAMIFAFLGMVIFFLVRFLMGY